MAVKRDKTDKRAIDRNGVVDSVSTSEVARRLGISSRSVCRLCSTGELVTFRTPGGHIRVRLKDLEEFEQRSDDAVSASPQRMEITRLSGEREQVQALSLQLQQRRIQRDLERFDAEDREAERKRAEAASAEQARSQAALEQDRREREERDRQRLEKIYKREADQQWQQWCDKWIQFALNVLISTDQVRSRFAGKIQTSVEQALEELGPLGPSRAPAIVEQVVTAATRRAIEPWLRQQEVELAVKQGIQELSFLAPTEWKCRAESAVREAIAHLAPNASLAEVCAVAVGAGRRIMVVKLLIL